MGFPSEDIGIGSTLSVGDATWGSGVAGMGSTVGTLGSGPVGAGGVTGKLDACVCGFCGSILNINGFVYTMSRPVHSKRRKIYIELVMCVSILFLMALSAFNVFLFLKPSEVLGTSTSDVQNLDTQKFWGEFLAKHPNYVPGWIEIGELEKAEEIDPNYFKP